MTRAAIKSTTRAALYVRISQDREGAGLGVQRQEQDCRELAARLGWNVIDVYVDNDVSASGNAPRPAWQRLIADVRAGAVDAIVVWHIDRMTRKPRELEDVIDMADQYGVQLATVTGDVDLLTPTGRMVARIIGSTARYEAEHKGERQRRQRLQAAQSGQPHKTGIRPFGYLVDFKTMHPVEAPLVADAARRVLAGESITSIAREWNEAGHVTTTGKTWHATAVRAILKSARISGRREVGVKTSAQRIGEIVAVDCWDAIITPAESDRLRAMLSDRRRAPGSTARKYLLSGFLSCSCGGTMAAATSADRQHYRCSPSPGRQGFTSCGKTSVTRSNADKHVVAMLLEAIESPELVERLQRRESVDPELVELVKRDEQELIDIAQDRADGSITRGEWATMRDTIDARLQTNRARLARQSDTSALALLDGDGSIEQRWERLNLSQQRAVVSAVLETVRVAPSTGTGCRFDSSRLNPIWRV